MQRVMVDSLILMQMWCFVFALFTAVTSFRQRSYPENVRSWTSSSLVWQGLSILTVVAASISFFETYRNNFGGGGGGGGGGQYG